jgi:hypothetical protein
MTTSKFDYVEVYYWRPEDAEHLPTYAISYKSINMPWLATRLRAGHDKLDLPVKKVTEMPDQLMCDPMKEGV